MKSAPDLSAIAAQLGALQRELAQADAADVADRELLDRARAAGARLRRSREIAAALPAMLGAMRKRGARVLGPYADRDKWRVIEIDAQGHRDSEVFDTEALALRYMEEAQASLDRPEHTTETALAEYKRHLTERGNKWEGVRSVVWSIANFFSPPIALASLTPKKCAALYEECRARPRACPRHEVCTCLLPPIAADTHRATLKRARGFLGWCVAQGWLESNPLAEVQGIGKLRPRGKSLGKSGAELRVREARAWFERALELANAGDDRATGALVAMLLGMRASEIVSRRVADVDADQAPGDLLWIPCSKTKAGRRTLEVPDVLQPLLVACCEGKAPDRFVFESRSGKHRPSKWIIRAVHRVCDAAKVPRITAHALRGLLATLTAERGLAGHLIAATLGHESERVTMIAYAAPGAKQAGVTRRGLTVLQGGLNSAVQVSPKSAK